MKALTTILFAAAAAFTFSTSTQAAEEETFEGTLCCAKCCLKTADSCADMLKVGDVTYALEQDGKAKTKSHQCKGTSQAKVTGKVVERDGKKVIIVSKIEKEEKKKK